MKRMLILWVISLGLLTASAWSEGTRDSTETAEAEIRARQRYEEYKQALKKVHPVRIERMRNRPKNPIANLDFTLYRLEKDRIRLDSVYLSASNYYGGGFMKESEYLLLGYTKSGGPCYLLYLPPVDFQYHSPAGVILRDSVSVSVNFPLCHNAGYFEVYRVTGKAEEDGWELVLKGELPSYIEGIRMQQGDD